MLVLAKEESNEARRPTLWRTKPLPKCQCLKIVGETLFASDPPCGKSGYKDETFECIMATFGSCGLFFNTTCSPEDFSWCILAMVRQKKRHWSPLNQPHAQRISTISMLALRASNCSMDRPPSGSTMKAEPTNL